jgi:hypothetical protein
MHFLDTFPFKHSYMCFLRPVTIVLPRLALNPWAQAILLPQPPECPHCRHSTPHLGRMSVCNPQDWESNLGFLAWPLTSPALPEPQFFLLKMESGSHLERLLLGWRLCFMAGLLRGLPDRSHCALGSGLFFFFFFFLSLMVLGSELGATAPAFFCDECF